MDQAPGSGGFIEELDPARNLIKELEAPPEEGEEGEMEEGDKEEEEEAVAPEVDEVPTVVVGEDQEEKEAEGEEEEDQPIPEGETDETRVEEDLVVEGVAIPPPPPEPIVVPDDVRKISLEYVPNPEDDIPVELAADRQSMSIPLSVSINELVVMRHADVIFKTALKKLCCCSTAEMSCFEVDI
eukprot:sb/3471479/